MEDLFMPYCNGKNILFIHIPKTAGKAIEKSIFNDNHLKSMKNIYLAPIYFLLKINNKRNKSLIGNYDKSFHTQHLSFYELNEYFLGKRIIQDDKTIIFSVVRNPFDRLVSSIHHWRHPSVIGKHIDLTDRKTFETEVIQWFNEEFDENHNKIAHKRTMHECLANKFGEINRNINILRFENLENEFKEMCKRYEIDHKPLEVIGRTRHHNKHYRDYYTSKSRHLAEEYFAEDLCHFNYSF